MEEGMCSVPELIYIVSSGATQYTYRSYCIYVAAFFQSFSYQEVKFKIIVLPANCPPAKDVNETCAAWVATHSL